MSNAIKKLSWNFHQITNTFKFNALSEMVDKNYIDIIVLQEANGVSIPSQGVQLSIVYDKTL